MSPPANPVVRAGQRSIRKLSQRAGKSIQVLDQLAAVYKAVSMAVSSIVGAEVSHHVWVRNGTCFP